MSTERGFTLIELLTVVAIIMVLAALSLSGFSLYRASAYYAVASQTLHDARNSLEASLSDQNNLPPAIGLAEQHVQGPIQDPAGRQLLVGMQLPKQLKLQYSYDPTCVDASCSESFLQANHCNGKEYTSWTRFGDGLEVALEHVSGEGCP